MWWTAAENFTVNEGSTATYTVELATKPGGDVVVQYELSAAGSGVERLTLMIRMTGDHDRLTFTTYGLVNSADRDCVRRLRMMTATQGSATITHAVVDAESDEDYDPVHRTWRWRWL